jgi:hypothetical protein
LVEEGWGEELVVLVSRGYPSIVRDGGRVMWLQVGVDGGHMLLREEVTTYAPWGIASEGRGGECGRGEEKEKDQ